ncbi:MAG: class I SAM-dependent methyltransferase [Anaerolineae bacterium]
MARDTLHHLQPLTDHDGMSRRLAVLACKQAVRKTLETRLREQFHAEPGRPMEQLPGYRAWSSLNRAAQDRMWSLLAEQIDRDYARIEQQAWRHTRDPRGSLELGAAQIPAYQQQSCIHGQPGGYMLDRPQAGAAGGDLAAGILYEAGGNLYALGQGIGRKDSKAQRLIEHLGEVYPDLQPRRILELGCSAGGQSTDYPDAFPAAEIWAIDLSPGMLRYAHARAETLGAPVHFRQADAADTRFPDEHFDLVVSHNLFHEVAAEHMPAIMLECHRVLKPGGVVVHQDVPIQRARLDEWMQALSAWQKDHNDEPFWLDFTDADLPAMLVAAGFAPESVHAEYIKALDGPIPWYLARAQKPA